MEDDQQPLISSQHDIQILPSSLPSNPSETFHNSSYFATNPNRELPSPSEIRDRYIATTEYLERARPPPSIYPDQNLLVKWGTEITIAEGQCLYFLKQNLSSEINVPEIYAWRQEDGFTFLYMELIDGKQLDKVWDEVSEDERESICQCLKKMVSSLKRLKQGPEDRFIGSISRGPIRDIILSSPNLPPAGPFTTVREFHNWFDCLSRPREQRDHSPDPLRAHLLDDSEIVFTHGDLHPSNILISYPKKDDENGNLIKRDSGFVLSIIDWHQSGWLPEYWEGCKALWTAEVGGPWAAKYIPKFVNMAMLGPELVFKVNMYDRDIKGTHYDAWNWFVLKLGM
ncbi:uncharacterized protein DFL_005588 [Arthrobotrys flagrans]|uniref:Aminoglycoside phosphotransferase domain-containing protein n=1 Tax=Arthrobotrys flagrans TaxID=97331 RepID=A0A436ZXZ5_ARTFL|nr:hypothetical protein DFL_005588 [Arthrobotrys flagrans]